MGVFEYFLQISYDDSDFCILSCFLCTFISSISSYDHTEPDQWSENKPLLCCCWELADSTAVVAAQVHRTNFTIHQRQYVRKLRRPWLAKQGKSAESCKIRSPSNYIQFQTRVSGSASNVSPACSVHPHPHIHTHKQNKTKDGQCT